MYINKRLMRIRIPTIGEANPEKKSGSTGFAGYTKEHLGFALSQATKEGVKGLIDKGLDLPIAATVMAGGFIKGKAHASDVTKKDPSAFAEPEAVRIGTRDQCNSRLDCIAVNVAPGQRSQDLIAKLATIKIVCFVLPRSVLSDMQLIRPHQDDILDRARRGELPYEVIQFDDHDLFERNTHLFSLLSRDLETGQVSIRDQAAFYDELPVLMSA